MPLFTAWGRDGIVTTLIIGEGPPVFANGQVADPAESLIWRIEAPSWEEAIRQSHHLQGREPTQPQRDAAACASWFLAATPEERWAFLDELGAYAYPVSDKTWYVHPHHQP
jgi:hypothetical protein